jgi:hypothetical protein
MAWQSEWREHAVLYAGGRRFDPCICPRKRDPAMGHRNTIRFQQSTTQLPPLNPLGAKRIAAARLSWATIAK